ncbi:glycerophosphodiester phosphodiesterase [Clostridium sp. 19966]|uniref:glycerophosphodiester phosphodiesterase family protein n=1 Tax=Clostridium sp. 19966 TaxID=2768166 RepID=UPI0028DD6BF4|nr:glycerophosphodiester phosphodiesterase family protein [Clostridium sp. 19966]MDT8719640.1 glycerophosphodiester phosphodiesterase [Clostridium sp. 19966]
MKKKYIIFPIIAILILLGFIADNGYKKAEEKDITKVSSKINSLKPLNFNKKIDINNVKVVAHRALGFGGVENSLEAIQNSINNKVGRAEIDVQETKDGVVVLLHDRNLKRLTGLNKYVDQVTYKQIEKLNLAATSPGNGIERIPTLDSVIKASYGKQNLIIEIKPNGNIKDLTKNVVNIIDKDNFVDQCKVHSLNYDILLYVKRLNPHIQTGYIVSQPTRNLSSLKVDFYSIQKNIVNKKLVDDIHSNNKEIYAWSVDRPDEIDNMLKLNVDGIISDKPQLLLNMRNEKKPQIAQ